MISKPFLTFACDRWDAQRELIDERSLMRDCKCDGAVVVERRKHVYGYAIRLTEVSMVQCA
jgi:hypothetical protein